MFFENWLLFFIFSCAVFRLTRLIVYDQITSFLRAPFIEELHITEPDGTISTYTKIKGTGLQKWIGELLSCYWCTGVWISAFLLGCYYWVPRVTEPIIILFAIAGVAAIIETVISHFMQE